MKHLSSAFPEQSDIIELQRKLDPTFDGICQDFEGLSAALSLLLSEIDEHRANRIVDISRSLTGLKEEIMGVMKKVG